MHGVAASRPPVGCLLSVIAFIHFCWLPGVSAVGCRLFIVGYRFHSLLLVTHCRVSIVGPGLLTSVVPNFCNVGAQL